MKLFTIAATAIALALSATAMIIEPVDSVNILAARTKTECVSEDEAWITIATNGAGGHALCEKFRGECKDQHGWDRECYQPSSRTGINKSIVNAKCIKKSKGINLIISGRIAKRLKLQKPGDQAQKSGDGDWITKALKICKKKEFNNQCVTQDGAYATANRHGKEVSVVCDKFLKACKHAGSREPHCDANIGHDTVSIKCITTSTTSGKFVSMTEKLAAQVGLQRSTPAAWDAEPHIICGQRINT